MIYLENYGINNKLIYFAGGYLLAALQGANKMTHYTYTAFSERPEKSLYNNSQGFSLVELSIVLVILGLLTGGILTGQHLIRAAELRSVTTEFSAFQAAVNTFRDKYFALPGDMNNAEDFWGSMTNCGAASPSGSGTETCNGDGDGFITWAAAAAQTGENFAFWQQLANAGLVEGSYTGIAGSVGQNHGIPSVNIPGGKMSNAAWNTIGGSTGPIGDAEQFDRGGGNILLYGGIRNTGTGSPKLPVLTSTEMWNIDTKTDDGRPAIGKVLVRDRVGCTLKADGSAQTTAAADAALLDSTYNLADDSILCTIIFDNPF